MGPVGSLPEMISPVQSTKAGDCFLISLKIILTVSVGGSEDFAGRLSPARMKVNLSGSLGAVGSGVDLGGLSVGSCPKAAVEITNRDNARKNPRASFFIEESSMRKCSRPGLAVKRKKIRLLQIGRASCRERV